MKKRITALTLSLLLIASLTACGTKEKAAPKETKKKVEAVTPVTFQTEDIAEVTAGMDDRIVLQNAEGIDFLYNVTYDNTIVKKVSVDSKEVDLTSPGEYKAIYQIKVDAQALTDYLNEKNNTKKSPKIVKGENDISSIEKEIKVTVVTQEEAVTKADAGEVVWGSQNQPIAKSDGTEVKAKAETPESNPEKVVSATEVKKQTQSNKTENKKDTNKNTSSSSGSKEPSHTHNYNIPIKETVQHDAVGHNEKVWVVDQEAWDEPIYDYRAVCNKCGHVSKTTESAGLHSASCGGGYSVKEVQVGSKHHDATGHYENKWVVDKKAWTETKTVGWKCSCGAKK